jgi:hypothetical protein
MPRGGHGAATRGPRLIHEGEHPTDGSTLDADTLPAVIRELRNRGFEFTTVEGMEKYA